MLNPKVGGQNLVDTYFGTYFDGLTADQAEDAYLQSSFDTFRNMTQGVVDYQLAGKLKINEFPEYTNQFQFTMANYATCVGASGSPPRLSNGNTCEEQKTLIDHVKWIADNHICEAVESSGADEIWLFTAPFITAWENFMIGPTGGFGVNGPDYITPACHKHYIVASGGYGANNVSLHVYGHRVESTMNYLKIGRAHV